MTTIYPTSLASIKPMGQIKPSGLVRFGTDTLQTMTTHERWKKTEAEALALFKNNPDDEQLKKATQALFTDGVHTHGIKGVEFFDGSNPETPWVNDVCLEMGSNFTHVPASIRFKQSASQGEQDKKIGIFISPKYGKQPWILKHEILHVLQNKNGLHSGSTDPVIDAIASNFLNQFQQFPTKHPYLQGLLRMFRIADSYTVEIPFAFLKGILTGRLFKVLSNTSTETPGKAVRRYAEREMEVDKFFMTHGSWDAKIEHISHFFCESLLQFLRSFKLDLSKD